MRIVYDSEKHGAERVMFFDNEGKPTPCGAWDIKVDLTDLTTGKSAGTLHTTGWGDAKKRDVRHMLIKETVEKAKEAGTWPPS